MENRNLVLVGEETQALVITAKNDKYLNKYKYDLERCVECTKTVATFFFRMSFKVKSFPWNYWKPPIKHT